ncbi:MAG: TetR/AcrR family transcriptional regulator [Pseudomonadota bacterium]
MVSSQKDKKRTVIREAATRLFTEKGFENITTRNISSAAKISNAALYYYFDSKEDLLYQILDEAMNKGLEQIQQIQKSNLSRKKKLSSYLRMHAASAVDYNKMKLLVENQKSLSPQHRRALSKKQSNYVKKLVDLLNDLKREGELVDLDTKVCAFAFFGMVSWAYRWYNPEGKITPEQLSEIMHTIFTKGVFKGR